MYLGDFHKKDNVDALNMDQTLATQGDQHNTSNSEGIIGSGAMNNMTSNPKLLYNYKLISGKQKVFIPDGSKVSTAGKRNIISHEYVLD